jgi:hypothetical protein
LAGSGERSEYKSIGDKRLFEGIDSALQAALHWRQQDYQRLDDFAGINVPICVFGVPFWDFRIDEGVIGEPTIRENGHQVLSLPLHNVSGQGSNTEHPVIVVTTVARLPVVIGGLDDLWGWFRSEVDALRERLAHKA